jgi:hypothetical protein
VVNTERVDNHRVYWSKRQDLPERHAQTFVDFDPSLFIWAWSKRKGRQTSVFLVEKKGWPVISLVFFLTASTLSYRRPGQLKKRRQPCIYASALGQKEGSATDLSGRGQSKGVMGHHAQTLPYCLRPFLVVRGPTDDWLPFRHDSDPMNSPGGGGAWSM